MVGAARAVLHHAVPNLEVSDDHAVVSTFREQLHETGRFESGGGRFGLHLLRAQRASANDTPESVHQRIEEAQMFLEAAHEYQAREMNI